MRLAVAAVLALAVAASPVGAVQADPMAAAAAEGKAAPPPTATARYGADPLQTGELRVPAGKGPFPVAVLVHGGCWVAEMGSAAHVASVAEALRKRGIAVWNVEYRRVGHPGGGWPGTFRDVAAATDHLHALARRYPLDLKRVAFVGHSAGAHLASWAAARTKLPAPWTGRIRPVAAVMIDGPASLAPFVGIDAQVCGRPVIAPLMGGLPAQKPAEYRLASAADQWPLGARQLFVRGELGRFMDAEIARARTTGDPVEVLSPPNANHFDIVTPSTANGAAVVDFIATRGFR